MAGKADQIKGQAKEAVGDLTLIVHENSGMQREAIDRAS